MISRQQIEKFEMLRAAQLAQLEAEYALMDWDRDHPSENSESRLELVRHLDNCKERAELLRGLLSADERVEFVSWDDNTDPCDFDDLPGGLEAQEREAGLPRDEDAES